MLNRFCNPLHYKCNYNNQNVLDLTTMENVTYENIWHRTYLAWYLAWLSMPKISDTLPLNFKKLQMHENGRNKDNLKFSFLVPHFERCESLSIPLRCTPAFKVMSKCTDCSVKRQLLLLEIVFYPFRNHLSMSWIMWMIT